MNRLGMRNPADVLPPCKCCGRIVDIDVVKLICVLGGAVGNPPVIVFQCLCHNTRVIRWKGSALEEQGNTQDIN
jgi:hypothetical protein